MSEHDVTTDIDDDDDQGDDAPAEWRRWALVAVELVALVVALGVAIGAGVWVQRTIASHGVPWWVVAAAASVPVGFVARLVPELPRAARRVGELHAIAARRVVAPPSTWLGDRDEPSPAR